MSTKSENLITVYLAKAKSGRWYYTNRTFQESKVKSKTKGSFNYLNPIGKQSQEPLDEDAITTAIFGKELNDWSRAEMEAEFGSIAKLDTKTGQLYL